MGKNKYTTESFIEKAKKVHGNKWIYDKVNYINAKTKICIVCPKHGDFPQLPKNHLRGQGCPKCGKEKARTHRKYNYEPFLEEAHKRFGDDFSFPLIEHQYVNNKTYITVRCNKCGYEFSRKPNDLLSGKFNGCKNCKHIEVLERKKLLKADKPKKNKRFAVTPQMYLDRFRKKFGHTIEPFMDEYKNTQEEIHFKCNVCGYLFKRRPHNCLDSDGCPKCKNVKNQKLTNEEFKNRANKIHNYEYDYSESEYKGTDEPIKVICHEKDKFGDEHGAFWVTPHSHIGMMRSGCPKCSGKFRKDTEYFIKEARLIHGDKYIYDKTKYEKALKDVIITCPIHGDFQLTPNEHLTSRGCPLCKESHLEKEIRILLDENNIKYLPQARFDWLRTNDTYKKMSLDYFIEDKNIAIECQGIQHFNDKRFWPTTKTKEQEFLRIQERDKLKKRLCEEHGIKVLYYSNLSIDYPYQVFTSKEELLKEITK